MARFGVSLAAILVAVVAASIGSAGDLRILRQIVDRLHLESNSGKLRGLSMNVLATEGKVRLAGEVSTPEQLELVERIVGIVDGVKEVDNQLTIGDPRVSRSTETEALEPSIVRTERSQVGSSKTDIPAVWAPPSMINPPWYSEDCLPSRNLIPPPLTAEANAKKCSNDPSLSTSMCLSTSDPSPHIESMNTEQHPGQRIAQVLIRKPVAARVQWDSECDEPVESHASVVPFRRDLAVSSTHQLTLSGIPGRDGLEVSASLQILPFTSRTESYLAHMAIPVYFTSNDLDRVISEKAVTKAIFLDDTYLKICSQIVSSRFLVGFDPEVEVANDGGILAIVHIPAISFESRLQESTCMEPALGSAADLQ